MGRPAKSGNNAAQERLRFVDPLLSEIVDLMTDELSYRQRYELRMQIIYYKVFGDRRRSRDRQVQEEFEYIITNYVDLNENFNCYKRKMLKK